MLPQQETNLHVPDVHLVTPQPGELVQDLSGVVVPNRPPDGIVGAAYPSLGFEFDVGAQSVLRTPDDAMVAQLVLHLPKKNAPSVHIRLGEDTGFELAREVTRVLAVQPTIARVSQTAQPCSASSILPSLP